MGRVRTKVVKKAAKVLIEKYYQKMTTDFHVNKKILSEVSVIPSKRLRNKVAGFATHVLRRIQKGPVRGISLKLQEEEREKKLDYKPAQSKVDITEVPVDEETLKMLRKINLEDLPKLRKPQPAAPERR
jgi:small subunit ribosomal protein S17e